MKIDKRERNGRNEEDASKVVLGESKGEDIIGLKELAGTKAAAELTDNWLVNILIVLFQFLYSFGGLILGGICIIGGILLFINGISGSTSWSAKLLGIESGLSDAAPGAILFVVGLFIVVATRFVIKKPAKHG